jgi:RNA polymerase sigma-70 factor (ECF subfamily)
MATVQKFRNRKSSSVRFEMLVRPYFDALYAAARRFTASAADAEDLVQEVCMKAYLNLDDLERIEHKRAWLLRVLYNLFVDGQRKQQRSPVHIAASTGDIDEVELREHESLQPDEQADRMLRVDIILRAMALLDKEQCALLAMHDVEGLSLEELHEITDLPIGTIKSRLFRTRAKLGRLLKNNSDVRPELKIVGGKG